MQATEGDVPAGHQRNNFGKIIFYPRRQITSGQEIHQEYDDDDLARSPEK